MKRLGKCDQTLQQACGDDNECATTTRLNYTTTAARRPHDLPLSSTGVALSRAPNGAAESLASAFSDERGSVAASQLYVVPSSSSSISTTSVSGLGGPLGVAASGGGTLAGAAGGAAALAAP